MTTSTTSRVRIAYLLKRFPRLSETFILHEMLELERQGLSPTLFALLDPNERIVHADVGQLKARPNYFPAENRLTASLTRAHLTLLRRDPARYLTAATEALSQSPRRARLKHFLRAGWLALELERHSITHLHAHFANGPAAVAYIVHRLTGMPFSFTAHAKDIYTSPREMLVTKMRAARFVVTCTGFNAKHLAALLPEGSKVDLQRIYHGVDLNRFTSRDDTSLGMSRVACPPIILSVGRLVPKKGFPYLIDAARILRDRGYDFRLQIVGSGEMKDDLQAQISSSGLLERIQLVGSRPQEELVAFYRAATVFALPSIVLENGDRDGIPNVLVEAMSVGLPVVSTSVSGIPELVRDGETGLLVPPREADALANALAKLLDSVESRNRLAANGQRLVREEFDLRANAAKLRKLFVPQSLIELPTEPSPVLNSSSPQARGTAW